jgi:DnaD/phage-associated family protein
VDTRFLNDYLPYAPENYLKVYLFGLLKCQNSAGTDNNLDNFVNVLGLAKQEIMKSFEYWQEQNLVQILEVDPVEIRYLPVKDSIRNARKIENKKYSTFVTEVQEIISGRQIGPNEYYRYIDFIESYNFQPCDFNMIVKYCVEKKGDAINANYILTVARVWADEGIRTADKIEQKIEDLTLTTSDISQVAKALKFHGNLSIEHQQLYEKWTKSFGFSLSNILLLAKKVSAKTKNYSFEMLDKLLTKYFELKLMSFGEMEEYEANKSDLTALAREINKAIGIYYESVENEIDVYVLPWLAKGFNEQTLVQIANFCFKSNVRTLDGMDRTVQKFHKLGLTSLGGINTYLNDVMLVDGKIKEILSALNLDRRVNNFDRSFYKTWTSTYNFGDDVIMYAVSLSKDKMNSMQYANALITSWHDKNLKTLDEVKKQKVDVKGTQSTKFVGKSFSQSRSYTAEELNALFDNLSEIDV